MRLIVFTLFICMSTLTCFGQNDSTKIDHRSTHPSVMIPGIDSPMSGPGTLMQSSPNPNQLPEATKQTKGRTTPPSDPRAFGVGIPLGKAKKDSLR